MIEAMLMLVHREKKSIEGLYSHKFTVLPRLGEHIVASDGDSAKVYRVIAIAHPGEPTDRIGDIYVVHVGDLSEFRKSLYREQD